MFGGEAAAAHHTYVAGMIEKLVIVESAITGISLAISIISLVGGVISASHKKVS